MRADRILEFSIVGALGGISFSRADSHPTEFHCVWRTRVAEDSASTPEEFREDGWVPCFPTTLPLNDTLVPNLQEKTMKIKISMWITIIALFTVSGLCQSSPPASPEIFWEAFFEG
jgi:hypothetical protein